MPDQMTINRAGGDSFIGLLDIGSNSIRLVIYRAGGRLPHPQFNEREVCRLGEGINETGIIADDRMEHALNALARFTTVMKASNLDRVDIFATEALRRAANASVFIKAAEAVLPAKIRILSGEEEALLSAKGVQSGFVNVDGVVGDLGGGSLELAHIHSHKNAAQGNLKSLAMGHLLALDAHQIDTELKALPWLAHLKGKPFYAVGGTWRAIATLYITRSKRRIDIVHGLTLSIDELNSIMADIENSNGQLTGIPPARRVSMTQAVKVMKGIINNLAPSVVIFSSYGVREGILYDDLSRNIRKIDPLLAGVQEFGTMMERHSGLGDVLASRLKPFLSNFDLAQQRLALACCYLTDISWLDHPDYRANLAVEKMLGLSVVGIDHTDRAWMAAVLSVRYSGSFPSRKILRGLLSLKQREYARYVGSILRMLMTVSGGIPALVEQLIIEGDKHSVSIGVPGTLAGLTEGLVDRRIDAIDDHTSSKITSYRL